MSLRLLGAVAAAVTFGAIPALAQDARPAGQADAVLPDIVVQQQRRTEEAAQRFVESVSAPPLRSGSLAIWTDPLCVSVSNLAPAAAGVITSRIAARAAQVGVETLTGDCDANVIIVATADGAATADSLVRASNFAFRPSRWDPTQQDMSALRRFRESDAPVRWWTVSWPADIDTGQRLAVFRGEGTVYRRQRGQLPPGANKRQVMGWVIIVVDAARTADTPIEAVADYLAMVSLAEIDAAAETPAAPTILNLFRDGAPAGERMSEWDEAYLKALYESPPGWSNRTFSVQDVARRMAADDARTAVQ